MILEQIIQHKKDEVAAASARISLADQKSRATDQPSTRPFALCLRERSARDTAIIAEVKKGSPSKGIIRADFDPRSIAASYMEGGAACLSVLTDHEFFYGDLGFLAQIREQVSLPLLRKDFVIDAYQLYEARNAGADAVLLIAAALRDQRLMDFCHIAAELNLDVLLEVHDEDELERALATPTPLIGVNNRNLSTFVTDLAISERLLPLIPHDRLAVTESGIGSREDILRLKKAGAGAFLIGESLMRESEIAAKLKCLIGNYLEKD